jgi:hypothetical protein
MDAGTTVAMSLDDKAHDTTRPLRERRSAALDNLRALATMRDELARQIEANVAVARSANSQYYDYGAPTWADIGTILGISKQAAQQRFGIVKKDPS